MTKPIVGKKQKQWFSMDVHIHTPASIDYQQPEVSFLDLLQKAESRGLNIIAFTDHNTVAGYRKLREEIDQYEYLEKLNRILPNELSRLTEYRRLLSKILLLPGFEFTATFGFHIIGLFSPDKNIRELEHLLLALSIPTGQLDDGNPAIGASVDVINAYKLINEAGGVVIAAHANSSNGVAMRGMNFGGQTRIAYTQDQNLNALEVTDLELKGPRSTAAFFSGTKPEYPRRMHCIQGSDSHRLTTDPSRKKNLGVGDRATDVFLSDLSFEAIKELFLSNDFSRTRPHRRQEEPAFDFIQAALDEGPNIIQDFQDTVTVRGGKLYAVLSDICAFANTNGGTLFLGLSSDAKTAPMGINTPEQTIKQLEKEIQDRISPPLHLTLDIQTFKNKKIIRVLIPRGEEPPYALDDYKIYIRDETETNLAVRDEIVSLVQRGLTLNIQQPNLPAVVPAPAAEPQPMNPIPEVEQFDPYQEDPRTGVEVLLPTVNKGREFYTMRDLRNGNIVKNVTKTSARRLWRYAIEKYKELEGNLEKTPIFWAGDYGLIREYIQGKDTHYDFIRRTENGFRFFFGVTNDGIHGAWKQFLSEEEHS